MPIELRQFHQRHAKALKRSGRRLEELLQTICPVDGIPANEQGRCPVCDRQVTPEPVSDFVRPPDMSDEQAEAQEQFWARRDRQLREREQQEQAAAATKKKPPAEEPTGRDFSRVFDSAGNVRYGS